MIKIFLFFAICFSLPATAQELSKELYAKGNMAADADNMTDALKWFKLAADKGDSKAAYNVAIIYDAGLVGAKDPATAQGWFELAGKLGNPEGYFQAAKYLYLLWVNTYDSDRGAKEARILFQKAADLGDPDGATWVRRMDREIDEYYSLTLLKRQKAESAAGSSSNSGSNTSVSPSTTGAAKKRITCTRCDGKGKMHTTFTNGAVDSKGRTVYGETTTCTICSGKGYTDY